MNKEDFYWYWLTNIPGIGRGTIRRLLAEFGTPEVIYREKEEAVAAFLRNKQAERSFRQSKNETNIIHHYRELHKRNIRFLHPDAPDYPECFACMTDAPYSLYLKGRLPDKEKKAVAVIGTRSCTRYGGEMARFFGRELSKCGVCVISGLARGVDGMAHTGALEAGGYTLGILGGGIDRIYPQENYRLFMKMSEEGGILSESNIGTAPTAGLFPQRNRLIAGMADGILVVEAMEKSGTFITVDQGLEQGKEIFAVPGRLTDKKSVGCNNLIKLGAQLVCGVEDILETLHIEGKKPVRLTELENNYEKIPKKTLAPLEKMVYSCLRIEPKYLDEIICETKTAPQEVCMALNTLIVSGAVVETARNYYAIKI